MPSCQDYEHSHLREIKNKQSLQRIGFDARAFFKPGGNHPGISRSALVSSCVPHLGFACSVELNPHIPSKDQLTLEAIQFHDYARPWRTRPLPAFRHPMPLGADGDSPDVKDGTLTLTAMPVPNPARFQTNLPTKRKLTYHRIQVRRGVLPALRQGMRDRYVRWLQMLINQHHVVSPPLSEDGYFGPKTHQAVIYFQKAASLDPDGIVGLKTWQQVQIIQAELVETPKLQNSKVPQTPAAKPVQASLATQSVANWSLTRRFREVVLVLGPRHMGSKLGAQFRAMLTPTNLGILIGTLVVWAVSHAFGVGEAADVVLGAVGAFFLGRAAGKVAYDMGALLGITVGAQEYPDLDKAGEILAEVVAIIGITAFFFLIFNVGRWLRRGGSAGEGGASEGEGNSGEGEGQNDSSKKGSDPKDEESESSSQAPPPKPKIDPKVQKTLDSVDQNGSAPPGQVGGRQFMNDGRGGGQTLPKTDAQGNPIQYREWDVNPKITGVNRGPERLVTGSDGSAYYTGDHYQSFTQVR